MSKIKTNPSAIKNYIIAVKHSNLSDSKKDGIIKALQQYTNDKQEGIYTDGLICQLLFDVSMELLHSTEGLSNEQIAHRLMNIIRNMDRRIYFDETDDVNS